MSMNFSAAAKRALSQTWAKLVEGSGIGDAWLEFYTGEMPASPDDPVTTQKLLARLYVTPGTMQVEPDNAVASGDAGWTRLIGTNGRAVADFSISTKAGNGFWAFNTIGFRKGGPVSVFTRLTIFDPQPRDDDDDVGAAIFGSDA